MKFDKELKKKMTDQQGINVTLDTPTDGSYITD